MNTIQWGIIGCGDVTEVKSGPAFNKVANSTLVAVMRRDGVKAADYARRHAVPKWYTDAQQLINDPDVNAVYVATPPQQHEDYTILSLKAGKPVYVEKPMTVDSVAAQRMLQASTETGVKLSVAHYRKAQPRFTKLKSLLDTKAIGEVRMINLQLVQPPPTVLREAPDTFWRIDPAISGGGLFHDLSPHQLDLLQYFFGTPIKATGFAHNQAGLYAADDLVMGNMWFSNGAVFTGSWCFSAGTKEEKDIIEIIGSEGTIRFATFSTHHFTLSKNGVEQVFTFDELPHVQQPMIDAVVQYFRGETSNPSSAESAVTTMQIIDAFTSNKPI